MKLGIFGGTFDPIHHAHLFIAEAARQQSQLERVVFVPAGNARHRERPQTEFDDRCAMVAAAIAGNADFGLDRSDGSGTGYTADLLPQLALRYPQDSLTFIAGADSLARSRWARLDDVIGALAEFLIVPRDDVASSEIQAVLESVTPSLRERFRFLDVPRVADSASLIRERAARGLSIRYLVPDAVWRYIRERGLYGMR